MTNPTDSRAAAIDLLAAFDAEDLTVPISLVRQIVDLIPGGYVTEAAEPHHVLARTSASAVIKIKVSR